MNQTLKDMLAITISDNQSNLDVKLPKAVFAYHVSVNESTGFTPYLVNFGSSPQLPVDILFGTSIFSEDASIPQNINRVRKSFQTSCETIQKNLTIHHQHRKEGRKIIGEDFKIGNHVYVCASRKKG